MSIIDSMRRLWSAITGASADDPSDEEASPFGVDAARLYSLKTVNRQLADLAEGALESRRFSHDGRLPDNKHIISFAQSGRCYVAIVEVQTVEGFGSALVVAAVYETKPDTTAAFIEKLRALYN